jgi:glycosyltransferase involved in cell wall biosynthesis
VKVLHVISGLDTGGAEVMLAKLLRATASQVEGRVVSLTGDGVVGERIRALGVETVLLGMRRGIPDPRGVLALASEFRRFRPDVVQTWMYHADLIGGLSARLAGRPPVIWGIRNAELDDATARWTTRQTLRACALLSGFLPSRIVSCSERARDFHVARGYRADRIVVIPNGFEVDVFRPDPAAREAVRRELGIATDTLVVGMVARYHPMKDFGNFSQAAGRAVRELPGIRFVLCGDGVTAANAELTGSLRRAGVLERTQLLGRRDDVSRVLAAFDLFTLSSVTEGFPNALGEAMACGIPCVVTDAGDSRWILGDAGSAVPVRQPAELASAWCQMLRRGRAARARIGERGRERVASLFSVTAVAARFCELYSLVLRRGRP